jgi:hypothetical protein
MNNISDQASQNKEQSERSELIGNLRERVYFYNTTSWKESINHHGKHKTVVFVKSYATQDSKIELKLDRQMKLRIWWKNSSCQVGTITSTVTVILCGMKLGSVFRVCLFKRCATRRTSQTNTFKYYISGGTQKLWATPAQKGDFGILGGFYYST